MPQEFDPPSWLILNATYPFTAGTGTSHSDGLRSRQYWTHCRALEPYWDCCVITTGEYSMKATLLLDFPMNWCCSHHERRP